jgi:hypothetical protein
VNRRIRLVAALLLAFMLPIQAWAAACAQICARTLEARHAAMMAAESPAPIHQGHAMPATDPVEGDTDHCGKSEMGAGKCCQAHVFVVAAPALVDAAVVPSFERDLFVARWTNFIPEEPSPPPIASRKVV